MITFITGATGFIGNKLALRLAENGEKLHALCRSMSPQINLKHPNIKIFDGDVTDYSNLFKAMKDCDKVYHLAAYAKSYSKDKNLFYQINVDGTKNVCRAALECNVQKVVITSSVVTFGPTGKIPQDESTQRDVSRFFTTYEHSKYLAEKAAEDYISRGLNATFVNPTRIFGPGLLNESNSVTIMIRMYLEGRMRTILGDGNSIGNYGYIDDIVNGHILAMQSGRVGEKYILGGENVTYNKLFELISKVIGKRFIQFKISYSLALLYAMLEEMRAKLFNSYPIITPEWIKTFHLDWAYKCTKAEHELGYKITPLEEALQQTVNWINKIRKT